MAKKKKPRITRPPDPDDDWNDPEPDPDEAIALADEIIELITNASGDVWEVAYAYFERVRESSKGIKATVTRTREVTKNQLEALRGWRRGVGKWVERK